MKSLKVLALAAMAMFSTAAFAQWSVTGNLGFDSQSGDTPKQTEFTIRAGVDYQLNQQFSVGATIGYYMMKDQQAINSDYYNKENLFGIGVHGNYYMPLCKHIIWSPMLSVAYYTGKETVETFVGDVENDYSRFAVRINPLHFDIPMNERLSFTLACDLADVYFMSTTDGDATVNDFHFNAGRFEFVNGDLNMQLGFKYRF